MQIFMLKYIKLYQNPIYAPRHQQAISPAFFFAERRLYAPRMTIFDLFISNPSGI